MRLLVIALCIAVASATYYNKFRFNKMVNCYKNGLCSKNLMRDPEMLFGNDYVDDYADEYVDDIYSERMLKPYQCPMDTDEILGDWETPMMDTEDTIYGREGHFDRENIYGREGIYGSEWDLPTEHKFTGEWEYPTERVGEWGMSGRRGDWYDSELETTETGFGLRTHPLLKEITHANCKLASKLYKQCHEERDDKNTVVSPISIQLALATLNAGARGNTRRQIARVIAGSLQTHERRQIYSTLVRKLKGFHLNEISPLERRNVINPVTGIFVSQTTPAQKVFIQLVKGNLGATIKHCNFHRMPQQCRQIVNKWISQKTLGKVNSILPTDAITDNTKMILVNAMHVKANWGQQMRQCVTKQAKFFPLDSRKVKIVDVLETEGRFKYYEDELVKIVGLPTEQKEMTLYVIVPKEKDGLNQVEKLHLQDGVQLKSLLDRCDVHRRLVGVQLPKFQIKHKVDVRRTLRQQGVYDAFDTLRADFSGITGIPKSQVDELEHEQLSPIRRESLYGRMDDETMMDTPYYGTYGTEHKLHLNKFIHQSTIKITEQGITAVTGSGSYFDDMLDNEHNTMYGRSYRRNPFLNSEYSMMDEFSGFLPRDITGEKIVKANRAFAFVLKHNPTNQLVFVGRVIDAAQRKINNVHQTINVVDQF
jgi:serpin B